MNKRMYYSVRKGYTPMKQVLWSTPRVSTKSACTARQVW